MFFCGVFLKHWILETDIKKGDSYPKGEGKYLEHERDRVSRKFERLEHV